MTCREHLFERSDNLRSMLQALERGHNGVAFALMHKLEVQRLATEGLGKFGQHLNDARYLTARDLVTKAAARVPYASDRLALLLLELENDYVKAAARARTGASAKRYDPFWLEFDALARRRTHSDAKSVYLSVLASGVAPPHPRLSTAKDHYKTLMEGVSQRLKIVG